MTSPSQSLRVLHVSHAVNTGLAHCVASYVAYQVSRGLSVALACPGGRLGELAGAAGADVHRWQASRMPGAAMVGEYRQLRRIIDTVQPDVVHLHCAKAGLLGRLLLRGGRPTVFSPHAWSFLATDGWLSRVVREWERFATRWTTVTVCVGQSEARTGRGNGIRGPMAVLPNQVSEESIEDLILRNRAQVRALLGVSAGQPLAVCAARLCRQKGQDIAINAWPQVREAVPNAELVLIGAGDAAASLAAGAGPGVTFLGPLDRETTLRWMFAADVIVCPSRWEGMSLVPLEARALGRPVVMSEVDGAREAIDDGTGWLVPVEDTVAFGEMVAKVLSDPASAFDAGQLARARYLEQRATETSSADQLVQLYRDVVAGS